jgi:hypothetical protein
MVPEPVDPASKLRSRLAMSATTQPEHSRGAVDLPGRICHAPGRPICSAAEQGHLHRVHLFRSFTASSICNRD